MKFNKAPHGSKPRSLLLALCLLILISCIKFKGNGGGYTGDNANGTPNLYCSSVEEELYLYFSKELTLNYKVDIYPTETPVDSGTVINNLFKIKNENTIIYSNGSTFNLEVDLNSTENKTRSAKLTLNNDPFHYTELIITCNDAN